jgi:hypothetical protein
MPNYDARVKVTVELWVTGIGADDRDEVHDVINNNLSDDLEEGLTFLSGAYDVGIKDGTLKFTIQAIRPIRDERE